MKSNIIKYWKLEYLSFFWSLSGVLGVNFSGYRKAIFREHIHKIQYIFLSFCHKNISIDLAIYNKRRVSSLWKISQWIEFPESAGDKFSSFLFTFRATSYLQKISLWLILFYWVLHILDHIVYDNLANSVFLDMWGSKLVFESLILQYGQIIFVKFCLNFVIKIVTWFSYCDYNFLIIAL